MIPVSKLSFWSFGLKGGRKNEHSEALVGTRAVLKAKLEVELCKHFALQAFALSPQRNRA